MLVESADEANFIKETYLNSDAVTNGGLSSDAVWQRCYSGYNETTKGNWECLYSNSSWNTAEDQASVGYWGMICVLIFFFSIWDENCNSEEIFYHHKERFKAVAIPVLAIEKWGRLLNPSRGNPHDDILGTSRRWNKHSM